MKTFFKWVIGMACLFSGPPGWAVLAFYFIRKYMRILDGRDVAQIAMNKRDSYKRMYEQAHEEAARQAKAEYDNRTRGGAPNETARKAAYAWHEILQWRGREPEGENPFEQKQ